MIRHSPVGLFSRPHLAVTLSALMFTVACRSKGTTFNRIRGTAPTVTIVEPSADSSFNTYEIVTFGAEVLTYDDTPVTDLEHQWVTGSDAACDWDIVPSDGYATCAVVFESPGNHTVTVTVKDPSANTAADTISVELLSNGNPTIQITNLDDSDGPVPLPLGDPLVIEALVEDTEDASDLLTVVGVSDLDGDLGFDTNPTSDGDWADTTGELSGGVHTITLTVTDTAGKTAQDEVQITFNGVPSAPVVDIQPDPAVSGDSLEAVILTESVDPEGDPLTYDYQWYVDGTVYVGGTSPVIPSGITQRDQHWEVKVSPLDPDGTGDPGSDSLVIENSAPSLDGVAIEPESPQTGSTLTAVPTGWFDQDLDPETYEYEWIQNGVIDTDETTSTFPSAKTAKGDEYQVTITPVDDLAAGDPRTSTTTTILNTPPTSPSISITFASIGISATPEDDLSCTLGVLSTDDDDDVVTYTYEWTVDGALVGSLTDTVVPASYTTHGESWECTVTPNDGEEDGPSVSDSVFVSDGSIPAPPELDSPTPHRNQDSVDLTGACEADCILTFYCDDTTPAGWTVTDTCTSEGTFSVTISPLARGESTSCSATCTDAAGNVSPPSGSVSTEVCAPEDVYEAGAYGDSYLDPIDEWPGLWDDGSSLSFIGNILDDDDEDWYVISALDDEVADISARIDFFKFYATFVDETAPFSFYVYHDDPEDLYECSTDVSGYTEYTWLKEDLGDATIAHAPPVDSRMCATGDGHIDPADAQLNQCEDNSADFFIRVVRNSAEPASCDHYEISVSNGVW